MNRFRWLTKYWPQLACVVMLTAGLCQAQLPPVLRQGKKHPLHPNIILIVADDLGYGDLGCYGQKKIKTPCIDQLAAEGMRFTQCYAGSTVSAPSRGALMTGFHTGHASIRGESKDSALRPEDVTVAQVLKKAGYLHCGAIGEWDLGGTGSAGLPQSKGFDTWVGQLDQLQAQDHFPATVWRYNGNPLSFQDGQAPITKNANHQKGIYSEDLFCTAATNFVRINYPQIDNGYAPFFLYLSCPIPHANRDLMKATRNGMEVPSDAPYSGEKWPQPDKNLAAMVSRLDADVGRIIDGLKHWGIDDDTIVFFTSSNGAHNEGGNNPGLFQSQGGLTGVNHDLHEGGIRVPMIVRWPGRVRPGKVSDQVWAFWDFLPTVCELANATLPGETDGISILPTLLGREQTAQHDFLYWEFHENGSKQAARMGDWKVIIPAPGKPLELYNLKTDVAERKNVAKQHADIVEKARAYMKAARSDDQRWPLTAAAGSGARADLSANSGTK